MADRCQGHAPLRLAAPARAGGRHARGDPRRGPAAVRAPGLRGDDDGRHRGRGRRRAEDRLPRLRDQERRCCARSGTCSCAATQTTRRSPSGAWYREVLEEPDPERQLRLNARNSRVVKLRIGARARGHPQRGPARPRHRGAVAAASRPTSTPTSARSSSASTRSTRCAPASTSTARRRHPLDAQPPERLAAARRSSAAGRRSASSTGSPTPPARSCCADAGRRVSARQEHPGRAPPGRRAHVVRGGHRVRVPPGAEQERRGTDVVLGRRSGCTKKPAAAGTKRR